MTETTNNPAHAPLLLSARESAKYLNVSLRLFRDLIKRPGFPKGRALSAHNSRWLRSELELYAASLPPVQREEPARLAESRTPEAKAARKAAKLPSAHVPFPDHPANLPAPVVHSWREIR